MQVVNARHDLFVNGHNQVPLMQSCLMGWAVFFICISRLHCISRESPPRVNAFSKRGNGRVQVGVDLEELLESCHLQHPIHARLRVEQLDVLL
jgi:hypothetical protein